MKRITVSILLLIVVIASPRPLFAASDDLLGSWLNQAQDAKIEISKCGNDFCGKIVWLKEPVYPAGSKEGTPGTPKVDTKNPDASRRSTPIMGMQIMQRLAACRRRSVEERHTSTIPTAARPTAPRPRSFRTTSSTCAASSASRS